MKFHKPYGKFCAGGKKKISFGLFFYSIVFLISKTLHVVL